MGPGTGIAVDGGYGLYVGCVSEILYLICISLYY